MRILFISGTPYLPQVRGGVEVNIHEWAVELISRGHEVSVLAGLAYRTLWGLSAGMSATLRQRPYRDQQLGYDVTRSRRPWKAIAGLPASDVAVIVNGYPLDVVRALQARDIPAIIYSHGLGFEDWVSIDPQAHPDRMGAAGYISLSEFTAARFERCYGLKTPILPPVFRPERYKTEVQPDFVTLINPVPVKGVDLALAMAELCSDLPFRFVKGWPLGILAGRRLTARMRRLGNVSFLDAPSMKSVYARTRVLLVPSQWEAETWGRVATEAQYSGIPVLGSNRGGLPEAIGPGGSILPHDAPPEVWAAELRRLWSDGPHREEKIAAALLHSRRAAIDLDAQIDILLDLAEQVRRARPHRPALSNAVFDITRLSESPSAS